jgi:branched-chain amino acid transport system permease protein
MKHSKNWIPELVYAILLVFILVFPFITKNLYLLHILILAGMWVILCVSLHLLEITGLFTLCIAAFMGIGACLSHTVHETGVVLLGPCRWQNNSGICRRAGRFYLPEVKGLMFAIITLAFGEVVVLAFSHWPGLGEKKDLRVYGSEFDSSPLGLDIKFVGKIPYYF